MARGSRLGTWPRLGLTIEGWPALVRHFEAEYGPADIDDPQVGADRAGLVVRPFRVGVAADNAARAVRTSRYKTTSWSVRLTDPSDDPIVCELAISGVFARSLVQSALVEPLLDRARPARPGAASGGRHRRRHPRPRACRRVGVRQEHPRHARLVTGLSTSR